MACLQAPTLPTPSLPSPFTMEVPGLPSFSGDAELCCKFVPFELVPPPIPLPPFVLNPAFIAFIFQGAAAANKWLASLALDCPKE